MAIKIGTASYGTEFTKRNYFSLKAGDNIYRILPPLFELAEKGKWSQYYKVEYGYRDSSGKMKIFQDCRVVNPKTKMVEVESAAHIKRENLKAKQAQMKANGATEAELNKMKELIMQYNADAKHYVNAIDLQGNIGLLKLPYTAKQALDVEIKGLKDSGIDPLSVNDGRFFVFNKSGSGLQTLYTARVYKEKIKVDGIGMVERDVTRVLTEDVLNRLEKEAFRLDTLYPKLTSEQVSRIVNEGATAVDEIFSRNTNNTIDEGEEETTYTTTITVNGQSNLNSNGNITVTNTPAVNTSGYVGIPETISAKPVETVIVTPAAKVATQQMSEEEFLRSIGAM